MSLAHRLEEDEIEEATVPQLYERLGERDTTRLYKQSYRIDTDHDVPAGGGNSLDRKTKYLDRDLYQEAMDGEFAKTGLEPDQIIRLWCDHEHSETGIRRQASGVRKVTLFLPDS